MKFVLVLFLWCYVALNTVPASVGEHYTAGVKASLSISYRMRERKK